MASTIPTKKSLCKSVILAGSNVLRRKKKTYTVSLASITGKRVVPAAMHVTAVPPVPIVTPVLDVTPIPDPMPAPDAPPVLDKMCSPDPTPIPEPMPVLDVPTVAAAMPVPDVPPVPIVTPAPDAPLRGTARKCLIRAEPVRIVGAFSEFSYDAYVANCDDEQDETSPRHQRNSHIKVLAISVLIGRLRSVAFMIRVGCNDSMLPSSCTDDSVTDCGSNAYRSCFDGKPQMGLDMFSLPKKIFGTPEFPHIDAFYIVPFTDTCKDGWTPIYGGFSEVFKVRIHPSLSTEGNSNEAFPGAFALKRISPSNRSTFQFSKEVEALRKFSGQNEGHPHLIKLLAAFSHDDKHYLLFPWADSNLRMLWRKNPTPNPERHSNMWLIKQLAGLADAVRAIHQYTPKDGPTLYGRHGDIKPENILCFKSESGGDCLVISDEFATSTTRHRLPNPLITSITIGSMPGAAETIPEASAIAFVEW